MESREKLQTPSQRWRICCLFACAKEPGCKERPCQQGNGELSPLTELGQKPDVFGRQFFPKISDNSVAWPTPDFRPRKPLLDF